MNLRGIAIVGVVVLAVGAPSLYGQVLKPMKRLDAGAFEHRRRNVVASNLEGEWKVAGDLTAMLGGLKEGVLSFSLDEAVVAKLPKRFAEALAEYKIYASGFMLLREVNHPFLLIEDNGNMRLVWFWDRDATGDPFGDAESFIVSLVTGTAKANDRLFVGGDDPDEPFSAYRRVVPQNVTLETALRLAALWDGDLSSVAAIDSTDSVAIAKALASRKGPLNLTGLKRISPKTLHALLGKEDVQIPLLKTLELIQEPDGGVTEDFIVPEWLRERESRLEQEQTAEQRDAADSR